MGSTSVLGGVESNDVGTVRVDGTASTGITVLSVPGSTARELTTAAGRFGRCWVSLLAGCPGSVFLFLRSMFLLSGGRSGGSGSILLLFGGRSSSSGSILLLPAAAGGGCSRGILWLLDVSAGRSGSLLLYSSARAG